MENQNNNLKFSFQMMMDLSTKPSLTIIQELNSYESVELELLITQLLFELEYAAANGTLEVFEKLHCLINPCIYYAIRVGNTKLLEVLVDRKPGNYFTSRQEELDALLSKAYRDLKILKNVKLEEEMEFCITRLLLNLRFFSETEEDTAHVYNHDYISKRICFLSKCIALFKTECSSNKCEEKINLLIKCIAQNIFLLKQLLKLTYLKIPWEEMEFCLVDYIKSTNQQLNDSNCLITREDILKYLEVFSNCLNKETINVNNFPLEQLCKFPRTERDYVVKDIIKNYPPLEELYQNYQMMRDTCTLEIISKYVDLVKSVDPKNASDQLVIIRAMQVIGEHLKNSLESPKLSNNTSDMIVFLFPYNTSQLIISLRNSLSHGMSLFKYQESNKEKRADFFVNLQRDICKIRSGLTWIIYKNKFIVIRKLLKKILQCHDVEEIRRIFRICCDIESNGEMAISSPERNELDEIESLISELQNTIKNKSNFEENVFKKMISIIEAEKNKFSGSQKIYEDALFLLKTVNPNDNISSIKYIATRVVKVTKPEIKMIFLDELMNLTLKLWKTCSARLKNTETFNQIGKLAHKIIWTIGFEQQNIKNVKTLSEHLQRGKKSYTKLGKFIKTDDFLIEKVKELKNILLDFEINDVNFSSFSSFKSNTKLHAKVEIVLFVILSILNDIQGVLTDKISFFDNDAPLLEGKNLRNYLAHSNVLNDVSFDTSMAIFLNAKIVLEANLSQMGNKLKKEIVGESCSFECKLDRDMENINNQKQLFSELAKDSLAGANQCILKGADIRGRDYELMTSIHYAAQSPNLECLKFLLSHGFDINAKNVRNQSMLHVAAASGSKEIVDFLITEQKMSIDKTDKLLQTPLHLAVKNGFKEVVDLLLLHKSKTNCRDIDGLTPLHFAIENNDKDIVSLLLKKEDNVNSNRVWGGFTLLHIAAEVGHLKMVEYLLEEGADVNIKNDEGDTALHHSVFNGHFDVAEKLILHGAEVNFRSNNGRIPLHMAVEKGQEKLVELLLKHGSFVNTLNSVSDTVMSCITLDPLSYAITGEYINIFKMLIEAGATVENSPNPVLKHLHYASMGNNKDILEIVLGNGAQVNGKDELGRTPLHYSVKSHCNDIMKLLIANGANINDKDKFGLTPLHFAAWMGNLEAAIVLISEKADISCTDIKGDTPIHYCIMTMQSSKLFSKYIMNGPYMEEDIIPTSSVHEKIKMMELLIKNGAHVETKNSYGQTPLHICCQQGSLPLADYLVNKSANRVIRDYNGYTPLHYAVENNNIEIVKILLENDWNELINSQDTYGKTSLCIAVERNYSEIVSFLVEKEADVNLGEPLFAAVFRGFQKVTNILLKAQNINICKQFEENNTNIVEVAATNGHEHLMKFLLSEMKKDSNLCILMSKNINDALFLASKFGHHEVIKLLLENGADVNKTNDDGITPLHFAAYQGHEKITQTFIRHGANFNIVNSKSGNSIEIAVHKNHLNIVKLLISNYYVNMNSLRLLHIASQQGHLKILEYLIEMGGDKYSEDSNGSKPIHIAAAAGHMDIVEYFFNCEVPIDIRGSHERTLLHYAAQGGHSQLCLYLINRGIDINSLDIFGNSSVHLASVKDHIEIIKLLLNNGAYLNPINNLGKKPIHLSSDKNVKSFLLSTEMLFKAVKHNNVSEVKNCILKGAMANVKNSKNESVLHYASWKADKNIVEILLRNKCNPNIKGKDESMPLHYASKFNNFEIVKTLLENGAIFNSPCKGKLPIELSVDAEIHELLQKISDCFEDIKNNRIDVINTFKHLMNTDSFKPLMNAKNIRNNTIILEAYSNDFSEMKQLIFLLEQDLHPMYRAADEYESIENYDKALDLLKSMLEMKEELLGSHNPIILNIRKKIARILHKQQKYEHALNIFREIHEKQTEIFCSYNSEILKTQSMIVCTLFKQGRYSEALEIFEDIYDKQKYFLDENHVDVLEALGNMTPLLNKVDRSEEALKINRRIVEVYSKMEVFGVEHPSTLAVQNNIGMSLINLSKFPEAEETFGKVYAAREKILGPHHSDTLRAQFYLVKLQSKTHPYPDFQKKCDDILKKFQDIYEAQSNILIQNNVDALNTQMEIGNTLFHSGRLEEALEIYSKNLMKRKRLSNQDNREINFLADRIKFIKSLPPIRYAHLNDIYRPKWELVPLILSDIFNKE